MVILRCGSMFDGEQFVGNVEIMIEDRVITGVTSGLISTRVGVEGSDVEGDVVVDFGADAMVLPGFVDTHQHLTWDCSPDPVFWLTTASDEDLLRTARRNAWTALASGVTTVRDLGDRGYVTLALRDETALFPGAGPTVLPSGPPITSVGGHCWFLGGEAAGIPALRRAVRERAAHGVSVVKVMATGGNVTPGSAPFESQFSLEELRAVVDEAHALGLPVAAHGHGVDGIADAVAAGVDTVEHCTFMTAEGIADRPDVLAAIADSGAHVSLTLGMVPGLGTPPPAIASRMAALLTHLRGLVAAGIPIALGTDAGIGPARPHDSMSYAVQVAAEHTSLESALRAATSGSAQALRLGSSIGRLRPGYDADLVILGADPRREINALRDVRAVIRHGVRVVG
ncbi:metal-dependent hydrolase family protein [Tessaracoccus antarcticus]|uniref:Amidohydrolase family protein n=1 Tax=Tessaracoccus antarcticus TaxID=2479848 RepID=A0A3M0GKU7_9ACTN|nr:amidohydrolase family protein [Tessaracoccus antarcticus]RMB61769.1 amidohydrolase family protein [Tessaracoccus antarcticus]